MNSLKMRSGLPSCPPSCGRALQFEKWNDVRALPALMDVVSGPLPNRYEHAYVLWPAPPLGVCFRFPASLPTQHGHWGAMPSPFPTSISSLDAAVT